MPPASHAEDLSAAVDGLESKFAVSGTVARHGQPLTVTVGDATASFPCNITRGAAVLKPLLSAAAPSAFGRGGQTVHDPGVRAAQELLPAQFSLGGAWAPPQELLEYVRKTLVPDAGAVTAELHKLNIYGPKGHFKGHRDTPRGAATCFGSLVVALPCPFTGGQLVCRHGGVEAVLPLNGGLVPQWSWRRPAEHAPSSDLNWAAFFGDVEHEVREVSEGHRVTLTYVLHRDAPAAPGADALLSRASAVHAAAAAALADPGFMPGGGTLGVMCRHSYEETALAQAEGKLSAGGRGAYAAKLKLKNEDAALAAALAAAGLKVRCLRLLDFEYAEGGKYALAKMPKSARGFGVSEVIEECFRAPAVDDDIIADFAEGTVEEIEGDVQWLGQHKGARRLFAQRWYSAEGYYGNEACEADFYTEAAIVAEVPEVGEGGSRALGLPASAVAALTADHVRQPATKAPAPGKENAASGGGGGGQGGGGAAGEGAGPAPKKAKPAPAAPAEPAAAAPPAMYAAQSNEGPRTIHVTGGKGSQADKRGGAVDVILEPSSGLRELKSSIRKAFGKYPHHKLGKLSVGGREVKSADELKHGDTVACNYIYFSPPGNPAIGGGGRRYRGGLSIEDALFGVMMGRAMGFFS